MTKPAKAMPWLLAHVDHQGDECLIWPFSCRRGYAQVGIRPGLPIYAYRLMCELVNGPPPTDTHQASHLCGRGNKGCVNPRHLVWKTQGENQLDRRLHGTKNNATWGRRGKLTREKVRAMRALKDQKTHDELAVMFDTCRRNVGSILNGHTWREKVVGNLPPPAPDLAP